jgi:peptide/nickel transport system permease protein
METPSLRYPLGTTLMGRDVLSQIIYGTQTTVMIGLVSGLISIVIGAGIGLFSGYYGGTLDEVLMRFTDIIYGMPFLPFIIVLISLFGRNLWFVIIAIVCIVWRTSARVVRAQTLSIRQRQFVQVAKARGCSDLRIIFRHIMPNILPLLLLYTAFNIAWSILAEAGASFLGFGDPHQLSWGGMLYDLWISGKTRSAWWWFISPSVCIILLVSALVFVSRAYEEVANPRLKER